jgi:hypothetical protein
MSDSICLWHVLCQKRAINSTSGRSIQKLCCVDRSRRSERYIVCSSVLVALQRVLGEPPVEWMAKTRTESSSRKKKTPKKQYAVGREQYRISVHHIKQGNDLCQHVKTNSIGLSRLHGIACDIGRQKRAREASTHLQCQNKVEDHTLRQRGFGPGTLVGTAGGGAQRWAIRDEGGCKQLCTRPAANTRSTAGTAASATEAPAKSTWQSRTVQTAAQTDRGQADKKQKGSRSHGMQKRRTSAGSKASTCSA